MKNSVMDEGTTIKNVVGQLKHIVLSLLVLFIIRELLSWGYDKILKLIAAGSIEWLMYYSMIKQLPIINVLFWLPNILVLLLITSMVFERVQLLTACRRFATVIKYYWVELIVWLLLLITITIAITLFESFIVSKFSIQNLTSNQQFVVLKSMSIIPHLVNFIFGLTYAVQLYKNFYIRRMKLE